MSVKSISVAMMLLSASVAFAQNTPPAGERGAGRTDPAAAAAARFKEIDKNSDGKLSTDEIKEFQASRTARPGEARQGAPGGHSAGHAAEQNGNQSSLMAEHFKAADTDKDGFLNTEEYTAMMKNMIQNRSRSVGGMGGN